MNKKFDNDNFVLYAPDSLDYITRDMEQILTDSLEFYKSLFDIDSFRKVQINYFDNIENFRNYVNELRGESESLPEYAAGTFDKGMINAYIAPNIMEGSPLYNKKKYNASHELFHIMYQELVWGKLNIPRIVWFDEGMAQAFSGEYQNDLKDFNKFIEDTIAKTKVIPNLNELDHGTSFNTPDYSGYRLSLVAVKYIYDSIGLEGFKKLIKDNDRIHEYGERILKEIFQKRG